MRSRSPAKLNLKTEEAGALVLAPASDFRSQQKRHKPHCETRSMTTTNMHEAASSHKCCDADASRATVRRCELLQWAADQTDLSLHLHGVLIRLVKLMDDAGAIGVAQTAIAEAIGLGERQTRAAIKELVSAGALKRTRRGAVGRGRAPDLLSANIDSGETPPLSENSHKGDTAPLSPPPRENSQTGDTGGASPLTLKNADNGDNAATSPVSVIEDAQFVDNSDAPYEGTGARAQNLELITTGSEFNPERAEQAAAAPAKILNGSAKGMLAHELSSTLIRVIDHPSLNPRNHRLAATCGELRALIDAGADFDLDIVPTVRSICERKNGEQINSYKYFAAAIRDNSRARKAIEAQTIVPITAEANANDLFARTSYASAPERREPLNLATRKRMQRRAKREAARGAIDGGRVDSERI